MGDGPGGAGGAVTFESRADTALSDLEARAEEPDKALIKPSSGGGTGQLSLRRFGIAASVATAVVAVPFVWILCSLWGSPTLFRQTVYQSNFYDLQTRAMLHGHLWLRKGSLGIEAFVHGGHEYTYFGLFPSLIRMPVLLVAHLDGKLTVPSMLVAWVGTAVLVSMLIWRVRILVRGQAVLGRLEATALGVLTATILGGTVWMLLAATPYVFNEDIAWSICLTIGGLFALLGVVERPSWARVTLSFLFILAANLDRATTGWACVLAAALIGLWFGLGRLGRDQRRWFFPMIGVAVVSLVVGCAVNYSKFGVLFGVSNYEQVWTHVNAYRRRFLAANHNAEEGVIFIPSNLLAYLRPDGIHLTANFPFVTLPPSPATALGGVLFDRRYRTASLPASTPLLVILGLWGLVTAFRPRPVGRVALTRILLLCAGSAGAALLLWGYISPRYLGDFVPFLALAGAIAMVDIWRRLSTRAPTTRALALVAISIVAVYSIVANIGMAVTPSDEWNTTQLLNYAQAQKWVSDTTGVSLRGQVHRGAVLPPYAPADQYFVIGNCDGLYISDGEDYSTVPSQQVQRSTWLAVERGHAFQHTFAVTVGRPSGRGATTVPLVTIGPQKVVVTAAPTHSSSVVQLSAGRAGDGQVDRGRWLTVPTATTHWVMVITDPAKRLIQVFVDGRRIYEGDVTVGTPIAAVPQASPSSDPHPLLTAVDETPGSPEPSLCQSLIGR